jgi:hypothetical protein
MPASSADFVALAVFGAAFALVADLLLLVLLVFVLLPVVDGLLLLAGFAEALVEPVVVFAFSGEDFAVDGVLAEGFALSAVFDAAGFDEAGFDEAVFDAAGFALDFADAVDRVVFPSAAGLLSVFAAAVFAAAVFAAVVFVAAVFVVVAGADLVAVALAGAVSVLAGGGAIRDFALAGPDMVMTAVVTVMISATESRRTRFMGVFFQEQKAVTGELFRYPLKAV